MDIAIGITHVPRPVETLDKSLLTMPEGTDITIYPDGWHDVIADRPIKRLGDKAGCFKHWYRVMEHLCKSGAPYVGIWPDDMRVHHHAIRLAMQKLTKRSTGYVACYTPAGLADRYGWQTGWNECTGGWATSWGGAYLFRLDVARELLRHPFIINHRDNYEANKQIDHAIPEAIHRMGLKQWYYVPSLMRHIGFTSTIGHTHTRAEDAAGW